MNGRPLGILIVVTFILLGFLGGMTLARFNGHVSQEPVRFDEQRGGSGVSLVVQSIRQIPSSVVVSFVSEVYKQGQLRATLTHGETICEASMTVVSGEHQISIPCTFSSSADLRLSLFEDSNYVILDTPFSFSLPVAHTSPRTVLLWAVFFMVCLFIVARVTQHMHVKRRFLSASKAVHSQGSIRVHQS